MPEITHWAGTVSGASTFTATVELIRNDSRIEGELRLVQDGIGQLHATLVGEWPDSNKVSAKLEKFVGDYSTPVLVPQSGTIEGTFEEATNSIRGKWTTDAGTEGDFSWTRIDIEPADKKTLPAIAPVQPAWITQISQTTHQLKAAVVAWHKRHPGWPLLFLGIVLLALLGMFLLDLVSGLSG